MFSIGNDPSHTHKHARARTHTHTGGVAHTLPHTHTHTQAALRMLRIRLTADLKKTLKILKSTQCSDFYIVNVQVH